MAEKFLSLNIDQEPDGIPGLAPKMSLHSIELHIINLHGLGTLTIVVLHAMPREVASAHRHRLAKLGALSYNAMEG